MRFDVYRVHLRKALSGLVLGLLLLALAAPASAKCEGEEFRQFDFWIGEWAVKDMKTGKEGMVNVITAHHDGCALREDYVSPPGYSGMSVNFYDKGDGKWHQTWIDNQGGALYLKGGLENGSMVLSSEPGEDGINRITWTPKENGDVRQHWEVSKDGGKTWETAFDGIYSKR